MSVMCSPLTQVSEDFVWNDIDLVKGDALIKDGPFSHLKASRQTGFTVWAIPMPPAHKDPVVYSLLGDTTGRSNISLRFEILRTLNSVFSWKDIYKII